MEVCVNPTQLHTSGGESLNPARKTVTALPEILMKEQKKYENNEGLRDFLHNFTFPHLASSKPSFFVSLLPLALRFNYLSRERERVAGREREGEVNAEYCCSTDPQHPLLATKKK